MFVAASQLAVSLGYILFHAHRPYRTVSFSSIQHFAPIRLRACCLFHLDFMRFGFSCYGCCCSRDLRFCFCASYFPPRFASRKSTFFLTVHPSISSSAHTGSSRGFKAYSPTGSYFSMLSGRWVRGRRKVMKKPVRAIDMRRTATVLDFAARGVSRFVARVT